MDINALPYLHALGDGGPRSKTTVVVIHATDGDGTAAQEAGYAQRRPDKTSAHFYIDDTTAYRALPLDHIAYGCLYHGNQISVQLELCGRSNQLSDATIRRAAPIVAEICATYGLPAVKLGPAQVRAGAKGICGHADITAAFPEDHGDHTDPGQGFPWATFIGYIQAATTGGFLMALTDQEQRTLYDYMLSFFQGLPAGEGIKSAPWTWETMLEAWEKTVDTKLAGLATVVAAKSAGAPTQDQINTAVTAALKDPAVQAGIAAALATHIKVS